ncbi:hypothetical protein CCR95_22555 [Thiocystis minor]|nr:hypothetical protein [Thiocystis minor]
MLFPSAKPSQNSRCARWRALLHPLCPLCRDLRSLTADARALLALEPEEDATLEIKGDRRPCALDEIAGPQRLKAQDVA